MRGTKLYILEKNPFYEEAPLLLAQSANSKTELDDARTRLQKLVQTGDKASFEVGLGTLALRERDLKTAEADFKRAQPLDPNSRAAFAALGGL